MAPFSKVLPMRSDEIGGLLGSMQTRVDELTRRFGVEGVGQPVLDALGRLVAGGHLVMLGNVGGRNRTSSMFLVTSLIKGLFDWLGVINRFKQDGIPLNEEQQRQLEAARFLLAEVFHGELTFGVVPLDKRYSMVQTHLERLHQASCQEPIAVLHLVPLIAFLDEANLRSGQQLGLKVGDGLSLAERSRQYVHLMESFMAAVVTAHPAESPLRELLLAPYEEYAAKLRQMRKSAKEEKAESRKKSWADSRKKAERPSVEKGAAPTREPEAPPAQEPETSPRQEPEKEAGSAGVKTSEQPVAPRPGEPDGER